MDVAHELDECADDAINDEGTEAEINPERLREARQEELSYFRKIELYDEVSCQERWDDTDRGPDSTKRADIMKDSGGGCKLVRKRLVARDLQKKSDRREELFAATPPLQTLIAMLGLAHGDGFSALTMDIETAHLNSYARPGDGYHYAQAPPESRHARAFVGGLRGGVTE